MNISPVILHPRPDIAKCHGTESELCERCCRKLAPSAELQWWTGAPEKGGECYLFADVEKYKKLYGAD